MAPHDSQVDLVSSSMLNTPYNGVLVQARLFSSSKLGGHHMCLLIGHAQDLDASALGMGCVTVRVPKSSQQTNGREC
jgi:hypothetical protein